VGYSPFADWCCDPARPWNRLREDALRYRAADEAAKDTPSGVITRLDETFADWLER
jgi:hypothetical protein